MILIYGALGLALIIVPCLFLALNPKSPLRSVEPSYINGFVMGMGFIFLELLGSAFIGGVLIRLRVLAAQRSVEVHPTT
jgi:hypothetical protein